MACDGMNGVDLKLEKELKVDGAFPEGDAELEKYVTDLMPIVRGHSDALVARDFSKAKQAALEKAIPAFLRDLELHPTVESEAVSTNKARAALFARLRLQTRYLRKVGRKALKTKAQRSDFDRVRPNEAALKAAQRKAAKKAKVVRATAKAARAAAKAARSSKP